MNKIMITFLLCILSLGAFNEDDMVNEALNAVDMQKYDQARDLYLVLYDESGKIEYLRESILVSAYLNDPQGTINLVRSYHTKTKDYDLEVEKVLADSYLRLGDVSNSISTIEKIKRKESTPIVHEILGGLYMQTQRFDDALKELNKAYDSTHSEGSLEKIIAIYLNTQKTGLAGDLLNTHLEKYGCSQDLCKRSIEFYIKTKQISRVEKLLEQIEGRSPTIQNATNLITVYAYQKKFDQALEIAKKYPLNRNIILELYVGKGDFTRARDLAMLIYQEEKNPEFLILAQVYEFELLQDKTDKTIITKIVKNLKKGLSELKKEKNQNTQSYANYLNFLGYLLIDYDLDVKSGMDYVRQALKHNPESIEFIDSLAWGYYKLGKCKEAKEEFQKIPNDKIQSNLELKKHKELLSSCNSE
ncbi:hypothetical protein [Helicobacter pametensis]|uniref:hypothetical protein n=1 Tax=Helicobacter pametensis TaxID=95149 RepID=UPI0004BCEAD3|nr:hypothetical protein [Helicobacter pametensis]